MDIRLYNKVFSNIYLKNKIFTEIRETNKQIVNYSNTKNQSFQQIANYEQSSFEWIIRNGEYELLKYKIENNFRFKGPFSYNSLISFISSSKIDKQLLNQFFKVYRDVLVNSKIIDSSKREVDILTLAVYSQNTTFFNLVLDDLQTKQGYSTKIKLKKWVNSTNIGRILKKNKIGLFDIALEYGNLDIIKSLFEKIDLVSLNLENFIYNSIKSENRNQIVEYLLNNYFPVTNHKQSNKITILNRESFSNLLKLNSSLLRKLFETGILSLHYESFIPLPDTIPTCGSVGGDNEETNKFIEFFKSVLLVYSVLKNDTSFLIILKKLDQLLLNGINGQYNTTSNNVYSIRNEDLITSNHQNSTILSCRLNPIVYKDFTLHREINRIFSFDFFKAAFNNDRPTLYIAKMIDFISKYNEFGTLDSIDQNLFTHLNNAQIIIISLEHGNYKTLEILSKKDTIFAMSLSLFGKIKLFNLNSLSISQQIHYIKSLVTNEIVMKFSNPIFKLVLSHLFSCSKNISKFSNEDLNEICKVIVEWRRINQQVTLPPLIVSDIFSINEYSITNETVNAIIYFYNNLPKGLINWDYSIIKSCNFELISFFIENISNNQMVLNSLQYCTNLKVAKFIIEKYSISFTNSCLGHYLCLDELKSGYLWRFAFEWWLKTLENNNNAKHDKEQQIKLNVNELTVNQIYYIELKLKQNKLVECKLILSDVSQPSPLEISKLFSKTIYDINYIISLRNDNFIYSFINSYKNETISNKMLYNKTMDRNSIVLLELSFNYTNLYNLINNL